MLGSMCLNAANEKRRLSHSNIVVRYNCWHPSGRDLEGEVHIDVRGPLFSPQCQSKGAFKFIQREVKFWKKFQPVFKGTVKFCPFRMHTNAVSKKVRKGKRQLFSSPRFPEISKWLVVKVQSHNHKQWT